MLIKKIKEKFPILIAILLGIFGGIALAEIIKYYLDMRCPICKRPIKSNIRACPYCRTALIWE